MFFIGCLAHVRRDGSNQPVAEQNAQERAHQGSSDFVANLVWWTAQGSHRHDTENGLDDAQSSSESAIELSDAVGSVES